ncbi:MAG: hypothetical protein GYA15_12405, partial [Leptolinea sp.]|nr:hypothetical protein [Leptolinea sp.]
MTTRAGFTGLMIGALLSVLLFPIYAYGYQMYTSGRHTEVVILVWIGIAAAFVLLVAGGFLAARWSRSTMPGRCAILGGLAGGLAGALIYCFWGAAAAGIIPDSLMNQSLDQQAQARMVLSIIDRSMKMYLVLAMGGTLAGMLGGYLSRLRKSAAQDVFDKVEPQMAMNVAITAVPACIVALAITAVIFPRLSVSFSRLLNNPMSADRILDLPLAVSLLNLLISHIALTLVVPHEA